MKKIILICLALTASSPAVLVTGCHAPSARVVEYKTLATVGASVRASMQIAAQLKVDGKLSDAQWAKIAELHDGKFLPAYNFAVAAAQANLDSVASPDVAELAAQLAALISSYEN